MWLVCAAAPPAQRDVRHLMIVAGAQLCKAFCCFRRLTVGKCLVFVHTLDVIIITDVAFPSFLDQLCHHHRNQVLLRAYMPMRPRRRTRATVFKLISPVNADVAVWTTASAYGHFTPAVVGTRGFWRSTTIFWCSSGQFGRCISYIMYPHFAAMKVWKCNIFESKKSNISAYFDRLFFELWVFKWASKCCDWTFIWMANST